jgi:hypothetical protein
MGSGPDLDGFGWLIQPHPNLGEPRTAHSIGDKPHTVPPHCVVHAVF